MQSAVIHDFHPETLAAPILLWALYFLITRRNTGLIVACVMLLLCKETMTLDVMSIGLFVAFFQRRWRFGSYIFLMGAVTLGLALLLMHIMSPIGQSPVAGRFDPLLASPVSTLLAYARDPERIHYLIKLLAPAGFLPLLSPWTAVMAVPSIAVNVLSDSPHMYSGIDQYNTDIGPMLIFAAIDAAAWIFPLLPRAFTFVRDALRSRGAPREVVAIVQPWTIGIVLVAGALVLGVQAPAVRAAGRFAHWPQVTTQEKAVKAALATIPKSASVSAQSTLVPHLSERTLIDQFPSGDGEDDYVVLDSEADIYPFTSFQDYREDVLALVRSCQYRVVTSGQGFMVLSRVQTEHVAGEDCSAQIPASFFLQPQGGHTGP